MEEKIDFPRAKSKSKKNLISLILRKKENSYHQKKSSPYYLIISFISCEKQKILLFSLSLFSLVFEFSFFGPPPQKKRIQKANQPFSPLKHNVSSLINAER